MKWNGIAGSWRKGSEEVKIDVSSLVKNLALTGEGIITGGALGVDFIATQTAIDLQRKGVNLEEQLKVFLPVKFEDYINHFRKRFKENVVTAKQVYDIHAQLLYLHKKHPLCVFDDSEFREVNPESYYARIDKQVLNSDVWYAFQVNDSQGVQYGVDKARNLGKEFHVKKYQIE